MSPRTRVWAFGSAGLVAIAGGLAGALVPGTAGIAVGAAMLSLGLGAFVLLVFLEVGLSEDAEREREDRRRRARDIDPSRLPWTRRPPRRGR